MNAILIAIVLGLGVIVLWYRLKPWLAKPAAPRPQSLSPPAAAPPEPQGELDSQFLRRIYELQQGVLQNPRVSTPHELTHIGSFAELVKVFAEPAVDIEVLLRYGVGDDAILAWAATAALCHRPRDPAVEARVLARLNGFHPWTRHFMLEAFEAWNPQEATLVGRVLVQLDESWNAPVNGVVLDEFLHRRAAIAPLSLADVELPASFNPDVLRSVLANQVDPELARELLAGLGPESPAAQNRGPSAPPFMSWSSLSDIGRVRSAGQVSDEGLVPYPSADERLERVLAALKGTPPRSTMIVGDAGVGKTSLVRRAAARLAREGWTIFEASASQLIAGMGIVGSFEAKLQRLRELLAKRPRTLWIISDFHQLLWTGRHMQSPIGAIEMLVPGIESGEFLIMGETRPAAMERMLAERPELGRLFEIVRLTPPPESEIAGLLATWASASTSRTRVTMSPEVLKEAALLARQYLSAWTAPGGVLRLLEGAVDRAAPRAGTDGAASLTADDVVEALSLITGLPLDVLDDRRALDLEAVRRQFESRVIGQPEAVNALIERLALIKAGVTDPTRPYAVFLFAGGTGTGKTELAKTLADYLFGSSHRLQRIDMSELQDASALERLLGGHADLSRNSLAQRVRSQPFCVVLLDEFEKAHPRVWDLFLQVFDDGRLTDPAGDTTDFRNTIIVLTTNLGAAAGEVRLGLRDGDDGLTPAVVERAVARTFRPELLNRLDQMIVFRPLTRETMRHILRKELADAFERRGLRRREWAIELEESAIELLVERGFSPALGARPLKRAVERFLLAPLARVIVDRSAPEGDQFLFVRANGDTLAVEFVDPDAPVTAGAALLGSFGAVAPTPDGLASIVYEPRGTLHEVVSLNRALVSLRARVEAEAWHEAKQNLLLESAAPGFWERADRFERLGRAEYLDRIESALRSAGSLLERLEGGTHSPRTGYRRELVRRMAQQLHLLDAAIQEALDTGPRDAFIAVDPLHDDVSASGKSREFARRLDEMYQAWARTRGMRLSVITSPATEAASETHVLAIAGFAAYMLLVPEDGLHVLEWEEPGSKGVRRATARVRVVPQPPSPPREGPPGLARQATEAFAQHGPATNNVVRRYREGVTPLVRDAVRGWRTGRIDRVLAGDFDVIPQEA